MDAKAMVLETFNQPLVARMFPVPKLKEGEILVRIEAAGVCGSDVHMWEGRDPRTRLPMILGHKGAGEIVEMKGEKKDLHGNPLKIGDKVLWNRAVTCGHCYYCKIKMEPSLCPNRWGYGIHTSCGEPPYLTGNYRQANAPSPEEFYNLDNEFHALIAELSGYPKVWNVILKAKTQFDRVRYLSVHEPSRPAEILAEHRTIADAVIARNADEAQRALRQHLRGVFVPVEKMGLTEASTAVQPKRRRRPKPATVPASAQTPQP